MVKNISRIQVVVSPKPNISSPIWERTKYRINNDPGSVSTLIKRTHETSQKIQRRDPCSNWTSHHDNSFHSRTPCTPRDLGGQSNLSAQSAVYENDGELTSICRASTLRYYEVHCKMLWVVLNLWLHDSSWWGVFLPNTFPFWMLCFKTFNILARIILNKHGWIYYNYLVFSKKPPKWKHVVWYKLKEVIICSRNVPDLCHHC